MGGKNPNECLRAQVIFSADQNVFFEALTDFLVLASATNTLPGHAHETCLDSRGGSSATHARDQGTRSGPIYLPISQSHEASI